MTKTILKVAGLAVCLTAAVLANTSINAENGNADVTLGDLTNVADANAECHPAEEWSASGRCLQLSQVCVFSTPPDHQCDPYKM